MEVNEARLNVTWAGQMGELPDPISYDAGDGDIRAWAAEAVRSGSIPNIPADPNVDFRDFVVDRFALTADTPYNRVYIRPKTPFGRT